MSDLLKAGAAEQAEQIQQNATRDYVQQQQWRNPYTVSLADKNLPITVIRNIGRVVHNANREIQIMNGEPPDPAWDDMPKGDYRVMSTIQAVQALIDNPDMPLEAEHETWFNDRIAQGWVYGPVKNAEVKTNPALVPYNELPPLQRLKDTIRRSIVRSMT